jgi:HAD superfamily hydrolase (TIGR01549 family)
MIKVAVFDFDGVLADSKRLYIETIQGSLLKNYFVFPKTRISKSLGPKIEVTLQNIHKFDPKIVSKIKRRINTWVAKKTKSLKICPYVKPTLEDLRSKKIKIILLTNSARKYTSLFLKRNKAYKFFDKTFCAEDFDIKEEAIEKIAKEFKVKKKEIVYVADRIADIDIAKRAKCNVVIVRACSWDRKTLRDRKEKFIIKNLSKLKNVISI